METNQTAHEKAVSALMLVDNLRRRAIDVVEKAPYWRYINNPDWARVTLEGDSATLHFFTAEMDSEVPSLGIEQVSFPSHLLFISEDALLNWKAGQMKLYETEYEQRVNAAAKISQKHKTDSCAGCKGKE